MSDEHWLKELAQVKRDQEAESGNRLDEHWDRLSAGTLTPEEEAELRALAETSEEARDAYEAFRPLGAEFQARVVQAIRQQDLPQRDETTTEPSVNLLFFWRSTSQTFRWAGWSTAAAVAAAALFFMVRGPASYPPLPVYAAELGGGDQEYRGETGPSTGLPVFSPGSVLTLDAAPRQPVTGPVEARAFLDWGGEITSWEPAPALDISDQGSVRLRVTLGQGIRLPPGEGKIWIVVGRPGKIPNPRDFQAELRAGRTRHGDWQAVSKELRVEDQASP